MLGTVGTIFHSVPVLVASLLFTFAICVYVLFKYVLWYEFDLKLFLSIVLTSVVAIVLCFFSPVFMIASSIMAILVLKKAIHGRTANIVLGIYFAVVVVIFILEVVA